MKRLLSCVLALWMGILACVPAVAEEEGLNLPWFMHGEEYSQILEEYDTYWTRDSEVVYRSYISKNVGLGHEMDSLLQFNQDTIRSFNDLIYELIVRHSFYGYTIYVTFTTKLIQSDVYTWKDDQGEIVISDEYYLIEMTYPDDNYRLILLNMYGEMDGGETITLRTIASTYVEEITDWSDYTYLGDLVARKDIFLKEEPISYSVRMAEISEGDSLTDCYLNSDGWVYCNYDRLYGYAPMEYLYDPDSSDLPDSDSSNYGDYGVPERTLSIDEMWASATSELTDEYGAYPASQACDGDLSTTWAEGVSGIGKDESLSIHFAPSYVTGFSIWNGYQKDSNRYYKNNRPSVMEVWADDAYMGRINLDDAMEEQSYGFGDPVYTSSLRFVIVSVYAGNAADDTCICEVSVQALD